MQMIIQSKEDLRKIQGKFVLQVDSIDPDKSLMGFKWDFVKEKRLYLVSGLGFIDLYGFRTDYDNYEVFKDVFNSYLFPSMKAKGETGGSRFHRLLTNMEIDFLCNKMKEENY